MNTEENVYNEPNIMKGSCMVHDKQTCLLLVQIIEICGGRINEAVSLINDKKVDRIVQTTRSICDSLHDKMLLSQVTLYIKIISFHPFVHSYIHNDVFYKS
jgi:ent-copalyl diphosphate synthase